MSLPADTELLDVWERGAGASAGERALLLLGLAQPQTSVDALAACSVGERDAALAAFRARTFGPDVSCVTVCASCRERLELEFALSEITVAPAEADQPMTVEDRGTTISFRLPTAGDLAALGRGAGRDEPGRWLLGQCITDMRAADGEAREVDELGPEALERVGAAIAAADPQADIELALSCPACGSGWMSTFDIAGFMWQEIEQRAPRLLHEVATLAAAFGWSEAEILALTPWRRARYLELAIT